jgi:hypothetical protein
MKFVKSVFNVQFGLTKSEKANEKKNKKGWIDGWMDGCYQAFCSPAKFKLDDIVIG